MAVPFNLLRYANETPHFVFHYTYTSDTAARTDRCYDSAKPTRMTYMNTKAKATQLSEISQFSSPKPLDEATWHMWVNTEEARGSGAVLKLVEQLREAYSQSDPVKALFAGHSGSGKSTEVRFVSGSARIPGDKRCRAKSAEG